METTNDKFICHGIYTISNSIGIEIQISNCGDGARCKYTNLKDECLISDWLEIEYDIDEQTTFILWDELRIDLNKVIKIIN